MRVRTTRRTLQARLCEVSSRVWGLLCTYCIVHTWLFFRDFSGCICPILFYYLDSSFHWLSNAVFQTVLLQKLAKIRQKVKNDGSAFLHDLDSLKHITQFLGLQSSPGWGGGEAQEPMSAPGAA